MKRIICKPWFRCVEDAPWELHVWDKDESLAIIIQCRRGNLKYHYIIWGNQNDPMDQGYTKTLEESKNTVLRTLNAKIITDGMITLI